MSIHIHIFGASGTGTSSLGKALAARTGATHLDTDSYFWEDTDPPFKKKRESRSRNQLLECDLDSCEKWILSGSLCGWGDWLIPRFHLAVFLHLDPIERMNRLREREALRFGKRIEPGGDMYEHHQAFLRWARSYDTAQPPTRSLKYHTRWMQGLQCPVLKLESTISIDRLCDKILKHT